MVRVIPDIQLLKVPVIDNGEKLVNLRRYTNGILFYADEYFSEGCYARKTIAQLLQRAQSYLPEDYRLLVIDAYRSMTVQRKLFNRFFRATKRSYPYWSDEKIARESNKWVSNPDMLVLHPTGGAVDITVAGPDGKELEMSIEEEDEFNVAQQKKFSPTYAKNLPLNIRRNRNILIKAMEKAGFVNYPLEWWHWDYGDSYWAAVKKTHAIYDVI